MGVLRLYGQRCLPQQPARSTRKVTRRRRSAWVKRWAGLDPTAAVTAHDAEKSCAVSANAVDLWRVAAEAASALVASVCPPKREKQKRVPANKMGAEGPSRDFGVPAPRHPSAMHRSPDRAPRAHPQTSTISSRPFASAAAKLCTEVGAVQISRCRPSGPPRAQA